ncbi:sugar ABC transporter ATP-binding protein [Anaerotruncus colihominis]|uniref:sugar ABC transporter ATP-binding protein n=1 Tax=Anaerotruncus colihominis TaxID=169435 RepID=UPI001898B3A8|nr:sugar ABC transporter ATP-binding protein [Anaerotruncus colihominis]
MPNAVLEIRGLTKRFPSVLAVDRATLSIEPGKVHAIVGGNGAGKSTLMKMLSGVYPYGSYEGEFFVDGRLCRFRSIMDAEANGISMVPQDLNMVNEMTVADNLFINRQPGRAGLVNQAVMMHRAQKIIDDFGLQINPNSMVKEIGIAQKQLIVIARAMHNQVKALILDEPTATLSSEESELLFAKVRELRGKGIACIYISHRLEEVQSLSDTITVMRDGRIIETDAVERMDERRIVSLMVGRDVDDFYPPRTNKPGDVVFRARGVTVYNQKFPDKKVVDNVAFDLRSGEILAVYGLVGSGRTEMAMGMIGAWKGNVECEVEVKGKEVVSRNPAQALENGISLLPEDRKREGAISKQSVGSNISASSLPHFSKFGVINSLLEKQNNQRMIRSMSIKTPSMDALIETLSGGNQQKVILSRLISADSPVLILDEATQGVDVEAKTQIYNILNNLTAQGKAILFISSDIAEVMGIADRIMVIRHGRVVKILDNQALDKEQVLWYATVGDEGGK